MDPSRLNSPEKKTIGLKMRIASQGVKAAFGQASLGGNHTPDQGILEKILPKDLQNLP